MGDDGDALRPATRQGSLPARLVVAGTHSGVGKTTVATGIMAAMRRRGTAVAAAKVGPDFIDPGYHALATGRPVRNLDAWMCGTDALRPLAARAAAPVPSSTPGAHQPADILVVEGVMGLFDGVGATSEGSTAHVAIRLGAPVVLVVDAAAMAASVAALVHGFATFDPCLDLAGVILNRVGSDTHEQILREALAPTGLPVLGALRRDPAFTWRDRHLGLVPVVEDPERVRRSIARLADATARDIDLGALGRLARAAPVLDAGSLPATRLVVPAHRVARVAVAQGKAFSFSYPDNLERMAEAGAELLAFDPLADERLPAGADALWCGGGFPEVYAEDLAANTPMLADVRARVAGGLVVWAECGGLLWLARTLDGNPLCGVVDAHGHMTTKLTLGYKEAAVRRSSPVAPAGAVLRGHEFHYSLVEPAGDALELTGRHGTGRGGFADDRTLASYLHLHLGADPAPAERFVSTAARRSEAS